MPEYGVGNNSYDGATCVTAYANSADTNTCCQAKRNGSDADTAGAGTTVVECPTGLLPKYGVGNNCCDGATCVTAVANSSDTNPCCQAKGKCGYADSAGAGTTAVVCPTEYLPKYGVDKNC